MSDQSMVSSNKFETRIVMMRRALIALFACVILVVASTRGGITLRVLILLLGLTSFFMMAPESSAAKSYWRGRSSGITVDWTDDNIACYSVKGARIFSLDDITHRKLRSLVAADESCRNTGRLPSARCAEF